MKRIAVLWSPDVPSHTPSLKALEEAGRPLHLQLQPVVARTATELESAFATTAREHAEAVFVFGFGPYIAARRQMAALAIKHRLPTFFFVREHVEAGGLMSYGVDPSDLVRRGAIFVDKILRGAKPGDLPVEQPTKFELIVNVRTARALGLSVPPALLARADKVLD